MEQTHGKEQKLRQNHQINQQKINIENIAKMEKIIYTLSKIN